MVGASIWLQNQVLLFEIVNVVVENSLIRKINMISFYFLSNYDIHQINFLKLSIFDTLNLICNKNVITMY